MYEKKETERTCIRNRTSSGLVADYSTPASGIDRQISQTQKTGSIPTQLDQTDIYWALFPTAAEYTFF